MHELTRREVKTADVILAALYRLTPVRNLVLTLLIFGLL